jgi:hypothetical protein
MDERSSEALNMNLESSMASLENYGGFDELVSKFGAK